MAMNTLKIREMILEPGRPKVAVPIVSADPKEIISECESIKKTPCDIIEWRADKYIGAIEDPEKVIDQKDFYLDIMKIMDDINYIADGTPVIFTVRSIWQGGSAGLSEEHLAGIRGLIAQSGLADLIDVELVGENGRIDEGAVSRQLDEIHSHGCRVILSHHDFEKMPSAEEMAAVVKKMHEMGADVCKYAAMASSREDDERLLKTTAFLSRSGIGPLIMIAMGENGVPARIAAGRYGSCVTFASLKGESAPGQPDIYTMEKWLDDYYGGKES